jgi:hypothetical protein
MSKSYSEEVTTLKQLFVSYCKNTNGGYITTLQDTEKQETLPWLMTVEMGNNQVRMVLLHIIYNDDSLSSFNVKSTVCFLEMQKSSCNCQLKEFVMI